MGWQSETPFERFGKSLGGLFAGPLLVVGGIALLYWNEGRYVHTQRDIEHTRATTKTLPCGATAEGVRNNSYGAAAGDTVYLGGCAVTQVADVTDTLFVGAEAAAPTSRMTRHLWAYLYSQHCVTSTDKNGVDHTSCTYPLAWRPCETNFMQIWGKDKHADSYKRLNAEAFQTCNNMTVNPNAPLYCTAAEFTAGCVNTSILVGGTAAVSYDIVNKLTHAADPTAGELVQNVSMKPAHNVTGHGRTFFKMVNGTENTYCAPNCSSYFGNMKVSFSLWKFNQVSIAGRLRVFNTTSNLAVVQIKGPYGRTPVTYAALGIVSKDSLFDDALEQNQALSWVLRVAGFALVWVGAVMFFLPAAKFIAVCSTCLGEVVEEVICCATCPFALLVALVTISIGWIAFRPAIGYPLLGVGLFFALFMFVRAVRQSRSSRSGYAAIN